MGRRGQAINVDMFLSQNHVVFKLYAFLKDLIAWPQQHIYHRTSESPSGTLEVIDHRTGNHYQLAISDNAIHATDLQAVNGGTGYNLADRMRSSLRVLDPGFQNTAVMKSRITFV